MSPEDRRTLRGFAGEIATWSRTRTDDARCKCGVCRRWMRFGPPTVATPATRRPAPQANRCTDCPRPCPHCGALPGPGKYHRSFCIAPRDVPFEAEHKCAHCADYGRSVVPE